MLKKYRKIILFYTLIWLLCASVLYGIFGYYGKSFFWLKDGSWHDGLWQHFVSFDYLCEYIESAVTKGRLQGVYNFTLGQGGDIVTTLSSYDFTDPVSVLSALFLSLGRKARFTLMIFIKLYLIGLSFIVYCGAKGCRKDGTANATAILIGAIIYTFSGNALFTVVRHPNFINWMYFFPLMLAGIEVYYGRKKIKPLVIVAFFNIITSFYTFYINTILAAIYVLVHFGCNLIEKKENFKNELIKIRDIAFAYILGGGLSAAMFLPVAYGFLSNGRSSEAAKNVKSLFHYDLDYYLELLETFFVPYVNVGSYYVVLGLSGIAMMAVVLLFTKKVGLQTRILFYISLFMLIIPIAGKVMNGFGYVSNRWCYAVVFYICVAFVEGYEAICNMTKKDMLILYISSAVYIAATLLYVSDNTEVKKISGLIFIAFMLACYGLSLRFLKARIGAVLLILAVLGALFQELSVFLPISGGYVTAFMDKDQVDDYIDSFSSTAAKDLDTSFYRVESEEETLINNMSLYRLNGTKAWWSTLSSEMYEYMTGLELNTTINLCGFAGLGGRVGLMELAGVKYYTRKTDGDAYVPYGYEEVAGAAGNVDLSSDHDTAGDSSNAAGENFAVYENRYALPLGYTYDSYITRADYENLDAISKEYALLNAAVLDDVTDFTETGISENKISDCGESLPYEITESKNAKLNLEKHKLSAKKKGALILSVTAPEDSELYFCLKDLKLLDTNEASRVGVTVTISQGDTYIDRYSEVTSLSNNFLVVMDGFTYNLSGMTGPCEVKIKFAKEADFAIDDIEFIAVPHSQYEAAATEIGKYVLENVNVGKNTISGTISVPDNRLLQMALPYSKGWKAYVDGRPQEIYKSGIMYMAIPIEAGDHEIEFKYETPYWKIGMLISLITLAGTLAAMWFKHK